MTPATNRLEALRNLRLANVDAAFATAFATLVSGSFLVGFVRYLGGSDLWIGALTAVPNLMGLLQLVGAVWGQRYASFKKFVFPGSILWRAFYLPLLALPYMALSGQVRLMLLLLCVAIASAATQIVNPLYNDWLATLVPSDSRGWFFSRRNAIATGVGALAGVLGGILLDAFRARDLEPAGYGVVFGLGLLCAVLSMLMFLRMTDTRREAAPQAGLKQALAGIQRPLLDKNFRSLLLFFAVFIAGQNFPGNLFSAFALESLRLDFTLLQVCALMQALGIVVSIRAWGFLADRYGNKPIIAILGIGLVLTPVMWLFSRPGLASNVPILIGGHIFSGLVWGGVIVAQYNLLLAIAPSAERPAYLAVALALQALMGAAAPLLGAVMMSALRNYLPADVAYRSVFGFTLLIRFVAVAFLAPVHEEGAVSIRRTLRQLRQVSPKGYRALRKLTDSPDVDARATAMADVATKSFDLASDEVIRALHDPSPRMRREAASALGRLDDPRSVDALVHQIQEHPDLIDEEVFDSLGRLGDSAAIDALVSHLDSPRPLLRRAAARALGRIGGPEVVPHLERAAANGGDPDLRRAALQGLRRAGATSSADVFARAMLDELPSVRIAAAEAISGMRLTGAAPALRESLRAYTDEAASEAAYALGVIGELADVPLILQQAALSESVITRRRCLLGLAAMLHVEAAVYRLMLLQGMSRDSALLDEMRAAMVRDRNLRASLESFSRGQEADALRVLAEATKREPYVAIAARPVEEAYIVAASAYKHQKATRRAQVRKGAATT